MPIFKNVNGTKSKIKEWNMNGKENLGKKSTESSTLKINKYGYCEKRVLVVYTGGTIGMVDDPDGFLIPKSNVFENLMRQFPQLHDKVMWQKRIQDADPTFDESFLILPKAGNIKCRVLYRILEYETLLDSSNMNENDWIRIAKDIEKYYEKYDGFVVLHGTDTLCYTASALSFMFENIGKAVVLTGSQIPIFEPRSDGVDNFVSSLLVAGSLNIPEVTIFFGSKLFRGNRTRKMSTSDFYAFESPNCAPLVQVGIDFEVHHAAIFRPTVIEKFRVNANMCRNVGLLRMFPSISTAVIKAFCQPPVEGIVLETYGAGNMPTNRQDVIDVLREAVARKVIVVIITQCTSGAVAALYETGKLLADAGVVSGSDMTPEAALTKLSYVLTKTELSFSEKTAMMSANIRGELTNLSSMAVEDQTLKEALGASLNIQSPKKLTEVTGNVMVSLLLYGIANQDLDMVKKLVEMGADVNCKLSEDKTPIHDAISQGNYSIIEYLLKNGASVHLKKSLGESPLLTAVELDSTSIIELLLKCGAHLSSTDLRHTNEIINRAIKNGEVKRLESLKQAGVDLDGADELYQTPLHKLAGPLILKLPADTWLIHEKGGSSTLYTIGPVFDNTIKVKVKDYEGRLMPHLTSIRSLDEREKAVLYNSPDIANFLITIGADKNKKDIMNYTPRDYAVQLKRNLLLNILG